MRLGELGMNIYVDAAGCTNACRLCYADGTPPCGGFCGAQELRDLRDESQPTVLVPYHEPSAHPEFPEIVGPDITITEGYLSTNGYGLARQDDYREVFDRLREFGVHTLSLTLHSLREKHDWFTRRAGTFDDILCASRRAATAGFNVIWQIILDRHNLADVSLLAARHRREFDGDFHVSIFYHRVGRRLWVSESLRPSLGAVQSQIARDTTPEVWDGLLGGRPLEQFTEAA
jgi:MoaA/NifB/PqqE/SkfB family radical SAM enzyme